MLDFKVIKENNQKILETSLTGKSLLTIPQLNKGTAFSEQERLDLGLIGKLPHRIETLQEQVDRAYVQYKSYNNLLNRNTYLNELLNNNQVVFYKLVQEHLQEMLPTLYTPIVGEAVQSFNRKFLQPRGLYIAHTDIDYIDQILQNRSHPEVDLIVVSDGEGVLGIGDQGIGAMEIPIAKLMVYTAFGGINPMNTLPILLDAGTNNQELLKDPLYLGCRQNRISPDEYDAFIHRFIEAVKKAFPKVFLHWEDFGRHNANRNLKAYREQICSFNDDIQGTGVVTAAAILAASKLSGTELADHRIVIFGAGTAGIGVAENLLNLICMNGIERNDAIKQFWLLDRPGLISKLVEEEMTEDQIAYQRNKDEIDSWKVDDPKHVNLLEVINNVKPTILIGCSAMAGAFKEDVVKAMASYVDRPIIFPLSNPTEKAEARPVDLISWTDGKAIIATGSPFEPVEHDGVTYPISQCNNYFAFPGIGLGVVSCKPSRVSNGMLLAASETLSNYAQDNPPKLLPTIPEATQASRDIAVALAHTAIQEGLSPLSPDQVEQAVDENCWQPEYLPYRHVPRQPQSD